MLNQKSTREQLSRSRLKSPNDFGKFPALQASLKVEIKNKPEINSR